MGPYLRAYAIARDGVLAILSGLCILGQDPSHSCREG